MKMVRNILIAAILLLNYGYDEVERNPMAITNATITDITLYPFMASIHVDLSLVCGGTVINRNLILTAAHCVDKAKIKSLLVCVGSLSSWLVDKRLTRNVLQIFKPDNYSSKPYRIDICLLLLSKKLDLADEVRPKQLPETSYMTLRNGWTVTLLGFGETERGYNLGGLRLATFRILNDDSCQELYGFPLESSQFCVGGPMNGSELRKGDDGSPILHNGTLIGIVSWFQKVYTVAVRIHDYMDFIRRTMDAFP